jgi:hypothetical protein
MGLFRDLDENFVWHLPRRVRGKTSKALAVADFREVNPNPHQSLIAFDNVSKRHTSSILNVLLSV